MEGWIKLHRKMLENPVVMKDADHIAVWIYLLLHATHEAIPAVFAGQKITLMPGQLITGRRKISLEISVNESKIFRVLNEFKSEHQIEQQTSNKNSLITILNWEYYQSCEQQDEQPVNSYRTTTEQQVNNKRTTSEHKQECKNIKNDKNERMKEDFKERDTKVSREKVFVPPTVDEVDDYLLEMNYSIDPEAFVDFYTSKNWMIGKNKMKDWKAAVRTWQRTEDKNKKEKQKKPKSLIDEWMDA